METCHDMPAPLAGSQMAPAQHRVPHAEIPRHLRQQYGFLPRELHSFDLELSTKTPATRAIHRHLVGALSPLSEGSGKQGKDHEVRFNL